MLESNSMWDIVDFDKEPTKEKNVGLLSTKLCGCGCGKPPVEGAEVHAVLLQEARKSLRKLEAKAKSGGERERKAKHLLWAWQRCEEAFESFVHGNPLWECGPPTPLWVSSWCKRIEKL